MYKIIFTKFTNKYCPFLYIKPNNFTYINNIRMIKYLLPLFIINNEIIIIFINKFRCKILIY